MKKNVVLLGLSILLASCSFDISIGGNNSSFISTNSSNVTSLVTTPNTSNSENSTPTISSTTNVNTNLPPSTTPVAPTTPVTVDRKINLFGINDFHGSVVANGYEGGILKIGSYFKSKGQEENTLLINAGDMWQGSIDSNHNYGKLLTECMNYIEFDAFTLGNHEFDWGQKYIEENRKLKDEVTSYQTPFLSANIYRYDMATGKTKEFADNLGDKYVIKTLENGLRVGIIGVIGKGQITSITSTFVDDLTFLEPTDVIKEVSDDLRMNHNVDVIIANVHEDQEELLNKGITGISSVSNKRYVDAVFCAHTHQNETTVENGVPFVQAAYNGRSFSEISLNVTPSGEVTATKYAYNYSSTISVSEDSKLKDIIDKYKALSDPIGSEKLINSNGTLTSKGTLMNLVTTAMYKEAIKQGFNVSYAITNSGRDDLESGTVTYSDLYKSLPFDNEVYIIDVSGSALKKEIGYSSTGMYRADKTAISTSKTYRIAVIDYMAVHRNIYRNYDYFSGFKYIDKLKLEGQEFYNFRDITADYLRSLSSDLDVSDFSSSLNQFNKSKITSNI